MVIDYIIVNKNVFSKVLDFKIEERVDSDHLLMRLKLDKTEEKTLEEKKNAKKKTKRKRWKDIIVWDEEAKRCFREKTETLERMEGQGA